MQQRVVLSYSWWYSSCCIQYFAVQADVESPAIQQDNAGMSMLSLESLQAVRSHTLSW